MLVTRRHDQASVLMLMPAAVLIVFLLGAMAFDLSVVFLRQRQASATAADIANDLAGAAFDVDAFRSTGTFRLDPSRARELGAQLAASSDVADELVAVSVDVLEDTTVRVTITLHADYVFARALPGTADGTDVHASATAEAARGSG
jgi:hypothetical protein